MANPRDLDDGTDIDRDDDAIELEDVPYDKLIGMLKGDDDQDEDIAFGAGEDTEPKTPDVISAEEGMDLVGDADAAKRAAAKVPETTAPEGKAEDTPPGEDQPPATEAEAPAPDADLDALLSDVPEAKRDAIRARVSQADEVMSIFRGRDQELQMHGVSPKQAMERLIEINGYAMRNPTDYLAWAATQFGNPQEILGKAAERFGFKLVATAGDGEEDPFEDPAVKEMRQRLAAYEARDRAPQLGPDAPQFRAQTELESFAGQAEHFQTVAPQIAALAQVHVQTTGQPATIDDIKRFYSAAIAAAGLQAATSAAQVQQPVAQQAQTTSAARSDSVERAKRASKSLDGSGQGAGRRPALDPDAPLETVLATLYAQQTKG